MSIIEAFKGPAVINFGVLCLMSTNNKKRHVSHPVTTAEQS